MILTIGNKIALFGDSALDVANADLGAVQARLASGFWRWIWGQARAAARGSGSLSAFGLRRLRWGEVWLRLVQVSCFVANTVRCFDEFLGSFGFWGTFGIGTFQILWVTSTA